MPNDTQSPHEMMSELEALEEMIADKCSVSAIDNSSVMDPETLRFCTTEQMRKVLNKVIQEYILFIPLLTLLKSERNPAWESSALLAHAI